MKLLVSTTGNFMYRSPITGHIVEADRISLVGNCNFYQEKIAQGVVKCHARDLPDEPSDAEWLAWLKASDGNEDLAVASFVSKFDPDAEQPESPKKKK